MALTMSCWRASLNRRPTSSPTGRRLRDESLEDSANLPDPHILAEEIADDLRAALEQIEDVLGDLQQRAQQIGLP